MAVANRIVDALRVSFLIQPETHQGHRHRRRASRHQRADDLLRNAASRCTPRGLRCPGWLSSADHLTLPSSPGMN
jgi:hypothetical protein